MTSVLAADPLRLDDPQRLGLFGGDLLSRTADSTLQALTEEAARTAETPIALVTLILEKVQFFRAHVGLPTELATSLATDRCTSFCQFVVAQDDALEIPDTLGYPGLPQELVKTYGIRSYFGVPVHVDGKPAGSLCVADVKPRAFPPGLAQRLSALAQTASERLTALRGTAVADAALQRAHLAVAELQPLLALTQKLAAGDLGREEFERALGALKTTLDASGELLGRSLPR